MSGPRVAVLVHGTAASIEASRARGLTGSAAPGLVRLLFREGSRLVAARAWHRALREARPDLVYVVGTAVPGVPLAAWWWRRYKVPYVLDTGDLVYEMARRSGVGAGWRLPALWGIERAGWRMAATIVVRGTAHKDYLERRGLRVAVIRDGFSECQGVPETAVADARARFGLAGRFVVGVLGSLVYSPRLQICYGWDLVRALARLNDLPVTGLVIGDGPGRSWLEAEARRLGVADRVVFAGRIPYSDVPLYLRLFDVALSTQTNNLPGRVRTTGKLPEYMAAGRFVLASRVGEAEVLLPADMLLPFDGEVDSAYPARLAARIRELVADPTALERGRLLPSIAHEHCSYEVLRKRWRDVVEGALSPCPEP